MDNIKHHIQLHMELVLLAAGDSRSGLRIENDMEAASREAPSLQGEGSCVWGGNAAYTHEHGHGCTAVGAS